MKFTGLTKYVSQINPSVGLPSEIIQMKGKDFARKMTPRAVLYQGKAFFHFNTFIYGLYMYNEYGYEY